MKRSEVNQILKQTSHFFARHHIQLPPFARFTPQRWQQLDPKAWQELFDLKLGWDVTAFGGNNFYSGINAVHLTQRFGKRHSLP